MDEEPTKVPLGPGIAFCSGRSLDVMSWPASCKPIGFDVDRDPGKSCIGRLLLDVFQHLLREWFQGEIRRR